MFFFVDGFRCRNPIKNERWNVDPATSPDGIPDGILHFCQGLVNKEHLAREQKRKTMDGYMFTYGYLARLGRKRSSECIPIVLYSFFNLGMDRTPSTLTIVKFIDKARKVTEMKPKNL